MRSLTVKGMMVGAVNLALFAVLFFMTPEIRNVETQPLSQLASESLSVEAEEGKSESALAITDIPPTEAYSPPPESPTRLVSVIEQSNPTVSDAQLQEHSDNSVESEVLVGEGIDSIRPAVSTVTDDSPWAMESESSAPDKNSSMIGSFFDTMVETFTAVRSTPEPAGTTPESIATTTESIATTTESMGTTTESVGINTDSIGTTTTESVGVTTLIEQSTMANEVVSVEVPMESKQQNEAAPQPEKREPPERTAIQREPKKAVINRYREEGYHLYQLDVPQRPTVRNRYTNL